MATYVPGQNIPFIGHNFARIGRVMDIVAQPCDVDPIVAVEAFVYSGLLMSATLFKPQYLNDQEEHFQHREILRPRRHGKRRINVDEELPGLGPGLKRVGWWIIHIGELAQRVGWYFLIIDAGTQMAVNWTSLAYLWTGCTDPTSGNAKSNLNWTAGSPIFAGGYVDQWQPFYATYPCWSSTAWVGTLADGPTIFTGEVSYQPSEVPGKQATSVVVQFENILTGETSPPHELKPTDPPYRGATWASKRLGFTANRQQWGCKILSADGYFGLKGEMRLRQSNLEGIGPDP